MLTLNASSGSSIHGGSGRKFPIQNSGQSIILRPGFGGRKLPDPPASTTNGSDAAASLAPVVTNPAMAAGASDAQLDSISAQFTDMIDQIYQIQNENNARMQEAAERQMRFQDMSQAKAMQFNAEQAALDRQWQETMSNTAHQREVQDLIAAGLNPVLSANGGAPVGSGASASSQAMSGSMADVDTSITNFMGNLVGAYASMHNAEVNAKAVLGAANINAAASQAIAQMQLNQPSTMFGSLNYWWKNAVAEAKNIASAHGINFSDLVGTGFTRFR